MARQAIVVLVVVIAFGILVPIYKGFGILDPRIIAAYACLALLFVAPASAELGATHGKGATASGILTRIAIIVAWGWGITVLILSTAIVTLNIMSRRGGWIAPPAEFIASVLVCSLSASVAIALLGAVLRRRFSAASVKTVLRTAFLVTLVALTFASRVLPQSVTIAVFDRFNTRRALMHLAWEGAVVFAVISVPLLLSILRSRPAGPFAKIPMAENPDQGGR